MKKISSTALVLLTIILMDLLTGMEFDLFVPSFPQLQAEFSLTPFWVEALISINFLGYCISLFVVGSLADRYGRKHIILLGLGIFAIGSILCLWAPCYFALLLGRFLHGIGIAAPAILSFLIIADSYPLKQQQVFMAMMNGAMNLAVAVSPLLGSYITFYYHWKGNFATLLGLSLIALFMAILFIPKHNLPEHKEDAALFDYMPLFKSKTLMQMMAHITFMIVPYWIFVGMSPLLYMKSFGVSIEHFGYYQGALALFFAFGSISFGFIINRFERKKTLFVTNQIFILSFLTVACVTWINSANPLLITIAFIPFVIAQIIPSTILYPLCLNFMPKAKGRVSAMIVGSCLILCALSLQLAGFVYRGSFQHIGMIILPFILMSVFTLFKVIKNEEVMNYGKVQPE
ncbi:MAG: MFS transporter [Tatlockia sp.]|jgi:DHA1 family bicyclomycin/chloramphenicol resistance-like MFS transporter